MSFITSTAGNLRIVAGHYTDANTVTLQNGGKFTVGDSTVTEGNDLDASLTFTGNGTLVLNNKGAASVTNEINIEGNASTDESTWHNTSANRGQIDHTPTSVLDLSQGNVEFAYDSNSAPTSNHQVLTKFNIKADGELIVRDDQFNYLLNNLRDQSKHNSAVSGAALNVDGGTLTVLGDVELDIDQISITADTDSKLNFSGDDGTLVANSITINEQEDTPVNNADAGAPLNIGSNTLRAESISLNNLNINSENTGFVDYQVADGDLVVGTSFTSRNANVAFGNSTSGASLQLGYIDANTDTYGIADGTYTTSAATGTVKTNVTLKGGASTEASELNVVFGDWAIQDLTATNAKITVGQDPNTKNLRDANGDLYTTSLTGGNLTLNSGVEMTVNSTANSVTFDTLNLAGAEVTVKNTTMTINGKYATDENGDPTYGLIAKSGTINVVGRNGVLALGADALKDVSATKTDSSYTLEVPNDVRGFVKLTEWATLNLALDSSDVFGEESLEALRTYFIANNDGSPISGGFIDIGEAKIDGVEVVNGKISWNDLEQYKDIIADIIADIITDDTSNATLIDVNSSDTAVQANVGNVLADGATQVVNFGDTTLRNGTDGFVKNERGEIIDARVTSGAHLGLYNGGSIGDVSLDQGNDREGGETVLAVVATPSTDGTEPLTTIASVDGKGYETTSFEVQGATKVTGKVDVGSLVVDKALTVEGETYASAGLYSSINASGDLVTTGDLNVNKLTVEGGAEYAGNITATGTATFGAIVEDETYYFAGDNSFKNVTFNQDVELSTGTTTAETVQLGQGLAIYGNGTLDADVLEFTNTATDTSEIISVGEPAGKDATTGETWNGSAGYMNVGRLDLAGRTLLVDPAYGQAASIVAVGQFGAEGSATELLGNDAGVLDGRVVGLQNSIVAMGVSDTADQNALDQVRATFANYLDANGSLSADNVGAIAYVAKAINVEGTSKIVLNSALNAQQYLDLVNGTNSNPTEAESAFLTAVGANNVYLGANTALAISADALTSTATDAQGAQSTRAAMHFDTPEASIYGGGGKIVLVNTNTDVNQEVTLFTDNGGEGHKGIMVNGQDITVESLSGLYYLTFKAGEETTSQLLQLNAGKLQEAYYAASDPVKATLNAYALSHGSHDSNALHGDAAPSTITYDAATNTFTNTSTGENITDNSYVALDDGNGGYNIYEAAYNPILAYTETNDFSGATAETVARMGAFAGVAQAALAAGTTTYDAISGRMGIGSQASSMTFAENGQGAGLWLTPVYKNHDSDSFDAEGIDYGVDMDLYGVALGADYTLANGLRVGAMFNIGSGKADGQGAGSAVTNDFDYYGFGIYAGHTFGQFSVVGDVSYTVVDNDVEANTAVDKVGASLDSTNLSVGVTAKYALDFDGLKVEPHAGLRYSSLDIDDYAVDGAQTYANFSSDSMDVFSIPVGVTIAKDFTAGAWQVKPSFDLTLTGNFGDDSFDGDVSWDGIANHVTSTSTEVLDNFTYGATVGVAAQTGSFSLGLGLNYTGSENANEFGVNANARYVF